MAKSLHTPAYEQFRSLLASARERAGLTQAGVAARLGRQQSFVAKYEGGERKLSAVEFIYVVQALGAKPALAITQLTDAIDNIER